jgi:hypothetical protein
MVPPYPLTAEAIGINRVPHGGNKPDSIDIVAQVIDQSLFFWLAQFLLLPY